MLDSFRDFWLELPLLLSVTIAYPVLYTDSSALIVFWFSSFDPLSLLSVTIANSVLYTVLLPLFFSVVLPLLFFCFLLLSESGRETLAGLYMNRVKNDKHCD